MWVIEARNGHEAVTEVFQYQDECGRLNRQPEPLSIVMSHPTEAVILHQLGSDPLAAFMEGLQYIHGTSAPLQEIVGMLSPLAAQQLLTAGQSIAINFYIDTEDRLEMLISYSARDVLGLAFSNDFVAYSLMMQLACKAAGLQPGKMTMVFAVPLNLNNPEVAYVQDPYASGLVKPFDLIGDGGVDDFLQQLGVFIEEGPVMGLTAPFIKKVAGPLHAAAVELASEGPERVDRARRAVTACRASDWSLGISSYLDANDG